MSELLIPDAALPAAANEAPLAPEAGAPDSSAPEPSAPAAGAPAAGKRGGKNDGGKNGAGNGNGGNGAAASPAGNVRPTDIIEEMQVAYLDYAMSVIVARALPDVRDGLKPVHRRILYAMWHDLGLTHDKPHKKSARIVGEVLGKYHPHGDTAVYDAMVRMAQPFSLRYPLVDGQGNFGSVDGDNAAAMRYTEARLASLSNLMLEDLEKDTVAWGPNFDNTLREPRVLPAALPNLLVNGSSGIAVGMATNIPPHNLGEVVDALAYMIDNFETIEDVTVDRLLQFIKGPDFPTGGIVYRYREEGKPAQPAADGAGASDDGRTDVIAQGYSTGKARLIMQAKAHFEEMARGRMRIIVTELPYQTNKTTLLERIADLVRDGKIEGVSDLRDESDRTGMRVVIELKRDVEPKSVLADLYKYTPLQQTFGMQLLALVDGQPRLLNLKRMLQYFIHHRQEIIRRRSEYDLARARERLHIVEGLLKALDILDEVIATIRRSQTVDTARKNLIANFKFSEVQAQAILEMQLRRLAALERKKLQEEHDELVRKIAWLEELLASPAKVLALIKSDLLAIKEQYGDARRTQIVDLTKGAHTTHDLLPEIEVWVSAAADGTLRRQTLGKQSPAVMRQIGRGSDGALLQGNTRDLLYLFTSGGRAARIGIHEASEEGKQFADLALFSRSEKLVAALPLARSSGPAPDGYLFLATEKGVVKRLLLADVVASVNGSTTVIKVEEKDRLGWAMLTQGTDDVMLVTSSGQAIRFGEDEVRSMGLAAAGVGGIKLGKNEKVIFAGVAPADGSLATLSAAGFAKISPLAEYPRQGRNGGGVVAHKLGARTGDLTAATILPATQAPRWLLLSAGKSAPRVMVSAEMPRLARAAQGKQVVEAGPAPVSALRWVPSPAGDDAPPPPRPRLIDEPPAPAAPSTAADSGAGGAAGAAGAPESKSAASKAVASQAAAVKLPVKPVAAPPAKAAVLAEAPAAAKPAAQRRFVEASKPADAPKTDAPKADAPKAARTTEPAAPAPPVRGASPAPAAKPARPAVKLAVEAPKPSLRAAAAPQPAKAPAPSAPARKASNAATQPGLFGEAEPPAKAAVAGKAAATAKSGKPGKAGKIGAVTSVPKPPAAKPAGAKPAGAKK